MDAVVKKLLRESGRTFAEEAGITLKDQPAALFKLLVL
ncbi:endonuclease, partial [Micromonospora aurantiaca]|nr:endonuclease [Micromonospora aurantiaca]